jgi:hypothetical protein
VSRGCEKKRLIQCCYCKLVYEITKQFLEDRRGIGIRCECRPQGNGLGGGISRWYVYEEVEVID